VEAVSKKSFWPNFGRLAKGRGTLLPSGGKVLGESSHHKKVKRGGKATNITGGGLSPGVMGNAGATRIPGNCEHKLGIFRSKGSRERPRVEAACQG